MGWRLGLAAAARLSRSLHGRARRASLWLPSLWGRRRWCAAGTQNDYVNRLSHRRLAGRLRGATAAEDLVQELIDVLWFHRIHSGLHGTIR